MAIFSGTKVEPIIEQLMEISAKERAKVSEITLVMTNSMKTIAKKCFPKAIQVIDRFHVQKLALEALQDIRIKNRWDAIDVENERIKQAMPTQETNYWPEVGICYTKPPQIEQRTNTLEAGHRSINILI